MMPKLGNYYGLSNIEKMNPFQKMLIAKIGRELPTFRQHRYRFYEEHAEFIKVIEIQFLELPKNKKAFTIHFGIYVPILYSILWNQPKPRTIEASNCTFFCNINSILTEFKGKPKVKYWDIEDLEPLLTEITSIIRSTLFPFSQKFNSLDQLNSFLNETEFPAKYVATYPILNVMLKIVLGRERELINLIEILRDKDEDYFIPQINDALTKSTLHGYPVMVKK